MRLVLPFPSSYSHVSCIHLTSYLGGGIGGLALTIGLLHQHISCTVYEAAHEFAEIGAGVSFGPNSIRAMSLLDPSIEEGYRSIETRNAWDSKKPIWFDFRLGLKPETWEKSFGNRVGDDGQWIAGPGPSFSFVPPVKLYSPVAGTCLIFKHGSRLRSEQENRMLIYWIQRLGTM
jgi:hypothetical protein